MYYLFIGCYGSVYMLLDPAMVTKGFSQGEIMQKYMEPCFFTYIKFFDRFYMISTC